MFRQLFGLRNFTRTNGIKLPEYHGFRDLAVSPSLQRLSLGLRRQMLVKYLPGNVDVILVDRWRCVLWRRHFHGLVPLAETGDRPTRLLLTGNQGTKTRSSLGFQLLLVCPKSVLALLGKGISKRFDTLIILVLFGHLLGADLAFYHNSETGALISRFTNDVNMMRAAVSTALTGIGMDLFKVVFLVAVLFWRDYGLYITNEHAKEIRQAHLKNTAVRTASDYRNVTINSPEIKRCNSRGVWSTAYATFYSRKEWNNEYREIALEEALHGHIPEINPEAFTLADLERDVLPYTEDKNRLTPNN